MMPRTFVMFVPVVKNKCVNWTRHRHGSLEKHKGLQFTCVWDLKKCLSPERLSLGLGPEIKGLGLEKRFWSRSHLRLKIKSLGLVSESNFSFTSLLWCTVLFCLHAKQNFNIYILKFCFALCFPVSFISISTENHLQFLLWAKYHMKIKCVSRHCENLVLDTAVAKFPGKGLEL